MRTAPVQAAKGKAKGSAELGKQWESEKVILLLVRVVVVGRGSIVGVIEHLEPYIQFQTIAKEELSVTCDNACLPAYRQGPKMSTCT